jgi:alkaline phosphatase D
VEASIPFLTCHPSWVSDLVWLDDTEYDPATGAGALGAEFAGTGKQSSPEHAFARDHKKLTDHPLPAVSSNSPFGSNASLVETNDQSALLIRDNEELQWQEGYYRGYYELQISPENVRASYFGLPNLRTRNGLEIPLANFTVEAGANALQRPIAGGTVEHGALKNGTVSGSNVTHDTNSGDWFVGEFDFLGVTLSGSG